MDRASSIMIELRRRKPLDGEGLEALKPGNLQGAILKVLFGQPRYTCSRDSLTKRVATGHFGVKNLRGARRERFYKRIVRCVDELSRAGDVVKYVTSVGNVRVRLTPRALATFAVVLTR